MVCKWRGCDVVWGTSEEVTQVVVVYGGLGGVGTWLGIS